MKDRQHSGQAKTDEQRLQIK